MKNVLTCVCGTALLLGSFGCGGCIDFSAKDAAKSVTESTVGTLKDVGAGVNEGTYVNQAFVRNSLDGSARSAIAEATVQIIPSPIFDRRAKEGTPIYRLGYHLCPIAFIATI